MRRILGLVAAFGVVVTANGTLEWGLPWFRGLAELVVLKGRIQEDGSMVVTRESRGWLPQENEPDMTRTQKFRREGLSP